jgi:hypothetical protein
LTAKLGKTGGDFLRIHDGVPLSWKWLTSGLSALHRFFYAKSSQIAIATFLAPQHGIRIAGTSANRDEPVAITE